MRRERALCVTSPLGNAGPSGQGGENRAEANVFALMESEEDVGTGHVRAYADLNALSSSAKDG